MKTARGNQVEAPAGRDARGRAGPGNRDRVVLNVAGTDQRGNLHAADRQVVDVGGTEVEVRGVVHRRLLEEGKHSHEATPVFRIGAPTRRVVPALARVRTARETAIRGLIVVSRQGDLLEVIGALSARAASRADCTAGSKSEIKTAMMEMTTSSSISVKPRDRNTGIRVFIRCNSSGMHVQLVMNTPVCNHRVSSGCIMLCKSSKLVTRSRLETGDAQEAQHVLFG